MRKIKLFKKLFKRKTKHVEQPLFFTSTPLNFDKLTSCVYVPLEIISNSTTKHDLDNFVRHKLSIQIAEAIENRLQLYESNYDVSNNAIRYSTIIRISFDR